MQEKSHADIMQSSDIIIRDQTILGGDPVFRGTRVPLRALLDYLESGQTLDEFLDDFPTVTKSAAVEALELAMQSRTLRRITPWD